MIFLSNMKTKCGGSSVLINLIIMLVRQLVVLQILAAVNKCFWSLYRVVPRQGVCFSSGDSGTSWGTLFGIKVG